MSYYTNQLEIRVFGMRRSGNHPIINWIGAQAPSPPHFFNCAPNRGGPPFLTGKARGDMEEGELAGIWQAHPLYKHAGDDKLKELAKSPREILMYSYEDFDLRILEKHEIPKYREKVVGRSKRKIDIIVIRDFYNWLSSKLIMPEKHFGSEDRNAFHNMTHDRFEKNRRELEYFEYYDGWEEDATWIRGLNYINCKKLYVGPWVEMAKESLGQTRRLDNLIVIHYNKWVKSKGYRRAIMNRIGFEFTDRGHNVVSTVGGGSSFDGREIDASQMKVFERWKRLSNNGLYKRLVQWAEEARAYNELIFGQNPEVMEWLNG